MHMSNPDQAMPVVQEDTLLYQRNGQTCRLTVGTPAWYAWLSTATTFAFRREVGTFTARREQAGHKRGGWYWRAYRKRAGKLHREPAAFPPLSKRCHEAPGRRWSSLGVREATCFPTPFVTHLSYRARAGDRCGLYPALSS